MSAISKPRIESIDFLKGLVMVIMALDHVRDYFHYPAFFYDPADPVRSTLPIFFTRFITHFCAPAFSFLAGISAFLVGKRKSRSELSAFLLKRGLWLVFIEMTIVNFAWYFDIYFRSPGLLVIWALGVGMIVLAALIHLPRKWILILSLVIIFGHNLLDNLRFEGNMLWAIIHEFAVFQLTDNVELTVVYPLVPWIAVMSLGFYFGKFYDAEVDKKYRRKLFNQIGIACLGLFFILRATNIYGDPIPFINYPGFSGSIISFFNPTKYPPSLQYLLMTLGAALIFLANAESLKGRMVNFFCTFGRVPFFFYILHLYLIHLLALVFAQLSGYGWQVMIFEDWISESPYLKGYGFSLWVVYVVWIGVILLLYPLCKRFDRYKQLHREKWWLSYL